jgi:DNA (cytosine-5)-methyltransferase 1
MGQKESPLRVLSLFSGAGGLDLGLEAAGFETRLCVEFDDDARATLTANRPAWTLATPGDIHEHDPEELLAQSDLEPGEVELLAGGPPCQPFSKSGYWLSGDSRRLRDPRANSLRAYLEVVEAARPRVVLLENVPGLAYEGKTEGLSLLTRSLEAINKRQRTHYRVSVFHLNAADFGVPQFRERFFVIADREGKHFTPPAPTHGDGAGTERYLTAWDAIGDLSTAQHDDLALSGKWAALVPSIPEGQNYLWHTPEGGGAPLFGWRTRFWSFLLKLAKKRPSWTIQASPGPATGPFHWSNRQLSTRELCRLQTIPDDYVIVGDRNAAQRQLGNAVPCALAEILGLEIRRQLLGDADLPSVATMIPKRSNKTPRATARGSVPPEYDHLRGKHKPHGGTGTGPAARKRSRVLRQQRA